MQNNLETKIGSVFESPFIQALKSTVRKVEVPLPMAKIVANVSALSVGDDARLRTAVMSPANYDRELLELIYLKTEFINPSSPTEPYEVSFEKFCRILTIQDKLMLLWGIYKCTYETLGKRLIECENKKCKNKFEIDIKLDDLIQEDSITPWDKESPVYEYVYPIEVIDKKSKLVYTFYSHIPSLYRTNTILSGISSAEIQHNLETLGSVYTLKDIVVSITKKIAIRPESSNNENEENKNIIETDNLADIDLAFANYIPKPVWDEYKDKYDEHFSKYDIVFYTTPTCPKCKNTFKYSIDLEVEFFRSSLLG